jgi:hypothetical protein
MEGENELAVTPADEAVTEKVAETTEEVTEKPEGAEAEAAETAEADKPEGDDGEEGEEKRKKPSGAERNKRRLQLVQAEMDRMAAELEEYRRPKAENREAKPGVEREPTEADFPNDFFAYERAKTAWEVRQAIREETSRGQQSRQQELQRELHEARIEAYEDNKEIVRERIPDFDKVVASAKDVSLKPAVVEELLASDKSALLQYHLAKNPDKARELNQMNGRELAREVGRLEARVHLPTPKKATEAAAPPSQVKGKAAPPASLRDADMETYVALRKKQGFGSR